MKTWSENETEVLIKNYNKVSNDELYKLLPKKSPLAIYKKAYKMGMRKSKEISFINHSIAKSGEKCNFWKGGKGTTTRGYTLVKMPEHHRADNNGYVLEHILVFEKETGIQVPDGCCIHHLNGIKNDNRISNLCMMTHSAHTVFHNIERKRRKKENKC